MRWRFWQRSRNAKNKRSPSNTEPIACPEGSVLLHQLCDRCTRFTVECIHLDQEGYRFDKAIYAVLNEYTLCTVSHILEQRWSCHLCNLIAAAAEEYKSVIDILSYVSLDSPIRLKFRFRERFLGDYQTTIKLVVRYGNFVPGVRYGNYIPQVRLYLRLYQDEFGYWVPEPLHWSSIPVQSRENLNVVKAWLWKCQNLHTECHASQDTTLTGMMPKRILDLDHGKLKLRCNSSQAASIEYMTLSHMWGHSPSHQIRLLKLNMKRFQDDIDFESLSPIYKEAIQITRALGYRYLWIDSLCIVQDSREDWEEEAGKMAGVYGNAVCNISFLFPPEDANPRVRKDPRDWAPCRVRQPSDQRKGVFIYRRQAVYQCEWLYQDRWPLFSRAWVFQEQLLSPRTLYCGHRNLMWVCSKGFYDELMGPVCNVSDKKSGSLWFMPDMRGHMRSAAQQAIASARTQPPEAKESSDQPKRSMAFCDWVEMVLFYRTTKLSNESDRIMAFAGVARAFHDMTNLTYLAGAWWEFLHPCLLWHVVPRNHDSAEIDATELKSSVTSAPRWSWFSVPNNHSVDYPWSNLLSDYDQPTHFSRAVSFGWSSHAENEVPESSYYNLTGLFIKLEARVLKAGIFRKCQQRAQLSLAQRPTDIHIESHSIYCDYDYLDPQDVNNDDKMDVTLAVIQVIRKKPGPSEIDPEEPDKNVSSSANLRMLPLTIQGLALVPGPEEGTSWRVGFFGITVSTAGQPAPDEEDEFSNPANIFDLWTDWKLDEITLI